MTTTPPCVTKKPSVFHIMCSHGSEVISTRPEIANAGCSVVKKTCCGMVSFQSLFVLKALFHTSVLKTDCKWSFKGWIGYDAFNFRASHTKETMHKQNHNLNSFMFKF